MPSPMLITAAFLGMTGVGCGAFGAHGLKTRVSADHQASFVTGAHYQIMHSAVLIGITALLKMYGDQPRVAKLLGWAFWMQAAGVALFSGSIYWLVLGGPKALGPVTPIGGTLLIGGWGALLAAAICM